MDLPQILLLTAIFVISIILTVIGVQIMILLRDARETMKKADHLIDNLDFLSSSIVHSSSTFSHLSTSLQSGLQIVGLVSKLLSKKK